MRDVALVLLVGVGACIVVRSDESLDDVGLVIAPTSVATQPVKCSKHSHRYVAHVGY